MIDLPAPPPIVANAIHSWRCWNRALPPYGPPVSNTCGSEEKIYALHTTRKLQAQYHEPDIRPVFDRALGEKFNEIWKTLQDTQRQIIKEQLCTNYNLEALRRRLRMSGQELIAQLRSAYHTLAARL